MARASCRTNDMTDPGLLGDRRQSTPINLSLQISNRLRVLIHPSLFAPCPALPVAAQITIADVDEALLPAAERNNLDKVLQTLVEHKNANVATCDSNGFTALHNACYKGDGSLEVVQYLVERCNANVEAADLTGSTPLIWACTRGKMRVVQYLVESGGANVNVANTRTDCRRSLALRTRVTLPLFNPCSWSSQCGRH
jgi:ankyrin repeat protein